MTTVGIAQLYLSRLILAPRSRQVRSELARPYEMHRTLMRAFPEVSRQETTNPREEFGVLFRADVDEGRNRVIVYVQSYVEPDWSLLSTHDYLLVDADLPNPACKDIARAYQRLENGQVFSFRLRANPTKRIWSVAEGQEAFKGKRVGLLREEEQITWLIRKGREREQGKAGGFEILVREVQGQNGELRQIPRINVRSEGTQTGRKKEEDLSQEMTHLAVRFDGLLRITDGDAFRETLAKGIGPAKAFGFGLLSVAAVR